MRGNEVIEFGDQLNTFCFKLVGKYDTLDIQVIGFGLTTLINSFFEQYGKEEPSLWTPAGNDAATYCMGDEFAKMYDDDERFNDVYARACAELLGICNSPDGIALEAFLLDSVGVVDCFPMSSEGTLILVLREGYGVNTDGTFNAISNEYSAYEDFSKRIMETNLEQIDVQPESSLYLQLPDY